MALPACAAATAVQGLGSWAAESPSATYPLSAAELYPLLCSGSEDCGQQRRLRWKLLPSDLPACWSIGFGLPFPGLYLLILGRKGSVHLHPAKHLYTSLLWIFTTTCQVSSERFSNCPGSHSLEVEEAGPISRTYSLCVLSTGP